MAFEGLTDKLTNAFKHIKSRGKLTESEYQELIAMLKAE